MCGNSKTVMMAAISPTAADYDETMSTMHFAKSVKQVQTRAIVNQINERGMEEQLRQELEELRSQLTLLQEASQGQRSSDPLGSTTAHRCSLVERRLEEQERLCRWFGKDWDTLIADEQKMMTRRRAIMNQIAHEVPEFIALQEQYRHHLDEGDGSDPPSETDSSATTGEMQWHCPLVHFGNVPEAEASTTRSCLRLKIPSMIAITGPVAATLTVEPQRVQALTRELHELKVGTAEADTLVDALSAPGMPRVHFRAVVVVDLERDPLQTEILIRTLRVPVVGSAGMSDSADSTEMLSREAWFQRIEWLQDRAAEGFCDASAFSGDVWAAAASATSSTCPCGTLPVAVAAAAAAAAANAVAEADRLKRELASAQGELSRLQSKWKSEKTGTSDLRQEVALLGDELSEAARKLGHLQASASKAQEIKEEFTAARDEVSVLQNRLSKRDLTDKNHYLEMLQASESKETYLSQELAAAQQEQLVWKNKLIWEASAAAQLHEEVMVSQAEIARLAQILEMQRAVGTEGDYLRTEFVAAQAKLRGAQDQLKSEQFVAEQLSVELSTAHSNTMEAATKLDTEKMVARGLRDELVAAQSKLMEVASTFEAQRMMHVEEESLRKQLADAQAELTRVQSRFLGDKELAAQARQAVSDIQISPGRSAALVVSAQRHKTKNLAGTLVQSLDKAIRAIDSAHVELARGSHD